MVCCDAIIVCFLIVMPCHLFFHHCLFSESACVNCSVYSIELQVFSLPGIPVWTGLQLIVGLCFNLDSASLMALVIVFKSSFLLFSVFTAVRESWCNIILPLVSLPSSSARHMAVISESSTDAESLSLIIISCLFVCLVGLFHIGNWNSWLVRV